MQFFAVTLTSVYRVSDKRDKNNWPIVEKIASRKASALSVGQKLTGGKLVGVRSNGIILYDEDHPRIGRIQRPEEVNTRFHGGHTSPIVALFFDEKEALACLRSDGLDRCDRRWEAKTEKVLHTIGKDHAVFVVSHFVPWKNKTAEAIAEGPVR